MKKIMIALIFGILLIGIVSAVQVSYSEGSETNTPADNWLGRLISQIKFSIFNEGTFTIYGRELGCSETADDTAKFKRFFGYKFTAENGEALFVNWFRGSPNDGAYSSHPDDSRQFIREDYIEEGETSKFVCDAGSYWNYDCYGEYYICPVPCYSNSDCKSNEICDKSILSQKIENAGVCKDEEQEIHTTKVYRCKNGNKTLLKSVSSGNLNYCPDENKNNYLIPGSESSGVCYSENNEPLICSQSSQIGTGEDKAISLTKEEWNSATPRMIVTAMCQVPSDCLSRDNYTSSCIFSDEIKNINKNALSSLKTSEGNFIATLCSGAKLSAADIGVIGIIKGLFWLQGGGYLYNLVCTDSTAEVSGTCRATPTDFWSSTIFSIGGFNITGMYLVIGILILLLLFIMMMGGRK